MTGIGEVAFVVFVRKRMPEIQYLRATITEAQRRGFGDLIHHTMAQVEQAHFAAHTGIRFPQNQCVNCAYNGMCLGPEELVRRRLEQREGDDLGWLDELCA